MSHDKYFLIWSRAFNALLLIINDLLIIATILRNEEQMADNINLHECDTFDEAKQQAAEDAANSFSLPLQAVMYVQAGRICFSTALPMSKLSTIIRFDSAIKGSSNPEEYTNRPIMADHVRGITEYLIDRDTYVLPGLTLNIREPIRVYTYRTPSVVRGAVIVVPGNTIFFVTDGQHRVKAIEAALAQKPELANDAVSVTLIVEPDIEQVHQDFADCAQTKTIPPSLLTLYNRQDELSSLTVEISRSVEFFHGRLEKVGKTVSKRSNNFYTLNHVRMCVGALLTGDSSQNATAMRAHAATLLASDLSYKTWRADVEWFFNTLANELPEWKMVRDANLQLGTIPDIQEFRSQFLHFSGTGLAIIGAAGYHILKVKELDARHALVQTLAKKVDWRRLDSQGAPNPFWVGTILTTEGNLGTSRYAVQAAVENVLAILGLSRSAKATA
jgi:DNA sulfur modification protein DndB